MNLAFNVVDHNCDVCVVGGGMAGICTAISAARHGANVILMHDRPVLGGNSSSECRVHISGADIHGKNPNLRETGILEELRLDNVKMNPNEYYPIWDFVLYNKAITQDGLKLLLNCSCQDAEMKENSIESITGWQLTTQTFQKVKAKVFVDCSGDGILAPLTGALYRIGREARDEFNESIAPVKADNKTMGMTCLFQAVDTGTPQKYEPPRWAYSYESDDELPYGANDHNWWRMGYWWIELGGEQDSIADTEKLRDELLKITLGVWDHIKNKGDHGAENWALEWIQFLPAKRESRRYIGKHILTQNDIESGGQFDDVVAYGGWSMDDHHPAGFNATKLGHPATIFHPAPSPYGIPLRAFISKNIDNLMFAGRCASATHAAMSSTRVMGTGCSMGQAVGTAIALSLNENLKIDTYEEFIKKLQQALLKDDCYIPNIKYEISEITKNAELSSNQGNPEPIRDGINRPIGEDNHCWECSEGDWVSYTFNQEIDISEVRLILDSSLDKHITLSLHKQYNERISQIPITLPKSFELEALKDECWNRITLIEDNYQRLVKIPLSIRTRGIRFKLHSTWGAEKTKLFAFYLD
ncbi:MAG: FAD-dependent oxidoreductase [Armatimonadota bacterium]